MVLSGWTRHARAGIHDSDGAYFRGILRLRAQPPRTFEPSGGPSADPL